MEINRKGCTRIVILTKQFAIKIPNFLNGWVLFLKGILGNHQERGWSKTNYKGFCPVKFSDPLGFLIVMERAQPLTIEEFFNLDYDNWIDKGDYVVPVENKPDSFGWLNNEIVAVDYGSAGNYKS